MFYRTATGCLPIQKIELKSNRIPVESESLVQPDSIVEKQHTCSKCERTFDKPRLIQYYACPHCMTKIVEEQKNGLSILVWLQRAKGKHIPKECVECEKVLECMLERDYTSEDPVEEIKKWY